MNVEHGAATVVLWGAALAAALTACTWTPEVRPVQARRVVEGPVYVMDHEEVAGEDYLLVVDDYRERLTARYAELDLAGDVDSLSPSALRGELESLPRNIVEAESGESCSVPGVAYGTFYQRKQADARGVDAWRMAYRRRDAGAEDDPSDDTYYVEFIDQRCERRGPRVDTWAYPSSYREPSADHDSALIHDHRDVLWWLDPFEDRKQRVATRVLTWQHLVAPPDRSLGSDEPAVILLEGERPEPPEPAPGEEDVEVEAPPLLGELVIRTLRDGEEVVRFGDEVSADFIQTNYGGLRVAWITRGTLFEAAAPDLTPVRLTPKDGTACAPRYGSGSLEFLFPCDEGTVNRLSLATGEVELLEPGVAAEWTDRGWMFEIRAQGEPDPETGARETHLWARPPGAPDFTQVKPDLYSMRPIDDRTLVGIGAVDEGYGPLGTWQVGSGFQRILRSVSYYYPYEDTRYTANRDEPIFLWLVHHDVVDGVGTISQISSRDLSITTVAEGVPVGGYRQYGFAALVNPALVLLRDVTPDGGVLEARLIPDLLGTRVDEGVIGFTSRSSHQEPGLYYSVGPGEREGIWFAPL